MEEILWVIVKWIITFILGSVFGFIATILKKESKKNKAIENAVQSLLRDRLIEKYRTFKTKKQMTILDKENIDHLYKEYINLGGNGTVKELMEDMDDIEIKIIKE